MEVRMQSHIKRVIDQAVETALVPLKPFISRSARKAYLFTGLFGITSFILLGAATVAFWLFYYEYVPQPGVERQIHLQFGAGHPHGSTLFQDALVPAQAYDISIDLHLPRTPNNIAAGNFMLSLSLLPSISTSSISQSLLPSSMLADNGTIAHSRRPAILTYVSDLTSKANTLSYLPLYVTGLSKESEMLTTSMFEGVEFSKGTGNTPKAANLIIEADEKMQFYDVTLRIIAKLSGLRWILYNHRILSFVVFSTMFWFSSMISMAVAWLALTIYLDSTNRVKVEDTNGFPIKHELEHEIDSTESHLSDTSRSFPTLGRQRPLKYESPSIKQESGPPMEATHLSLPNLGADADDEDDIDDVGTSSAYRDSGIGTGREERGDGLQRRRKGGSGA